MYITIFTSIVCVYCSLINKILYFQYVLAMGARTWFYLYYPFLINTPGSGRGIPCKKYACSSIKMQPFRGQNRNCLFRQSLVNSIWKKKVQAERWQEKENRDVLETEK